MLWSEGRVVRKGDRIMVRYSKKLAKAGHGNLINKTGVVRRVASVLGKVTGAYVDMLVGGEVRNVFIPLCSIVETDTVDKLRTLSILKSTKL